MSEKVLSKVNNDIFSYDTTGGVFKMSRVMPTEIHHTQAGVGPDGYILTSTGPNGNGWTWTDPSVIETPLQVLNLPVTDPKTYSTGADGYVLISKGSTDPPLWTNEISIHKVSATNFQCGSRNIVTTSAGCSFTALEIKPSTSGATGTFLINSNGDTTCHGTLSIDSISEKTPSSGITLNSAVKMTNIQYSTNANKLLYNDTTGEITYQPDSGSGGTEIVGTSLRSTLPGNNVNNSLSISLGHFAGNSGQEDRTIAIGNFAAQQNQSLFGIAIGAIAGQSSQSQYAIALGWAAGGWSQGDSSIAIGKTAANQRQGIEAIAIGTLAGENDQDSFAIAIGPAAGRYNAQGDSAVAIGHNAGNDNQGNYTVALGTHSATNNQADGAVSVGDSAGRFDQQYGGVSVGRFAGHSNQHNSATALGNSSGFSWQKQQAVAIGHQGGCYNQNEYSVAIGAYTGWNNQSWKATALGVEAGKNNQGSQTVAIGDAAGRDNQGAGSTAIGTYSGNSNQSDYGVALGVWAGQTDQGIYCTAVGPAAGQNQQGYASVAIGHGAGHLALGANSVAIGPAAGFLNPNSLTNYIVINAQNTSLDPTSSNGFHVKPINSASNSNKLLYNSDTGEITYQPDSGGTSWVPAPVISGGAGITLPGNNLSNYDFRNYTESGGNVIDADGNVIAAIIGGGTSFTSSEGVITSTSNYIEITNPLPTLGGTGHFSIEFYTRMNDPTASWHTYFSYRNVATNSYIQIVIKGDDAWLLEMYHNSTLRQATYRPFPVGAWDSTNFHHFVLTFSGGTTEKLYMDGVEVTKLSNAYDNSIAYDPNESFERLQISGSQSYDSNIETTKYFRLYNGVLNNEDITFLYENKENSTSSGTTDITNYALVSNNADGTETKWLNVTQIPSASFSLTDTTPAGTGSFPANTISTVNGAFTNVATSGAITNNNNGTFTINVAGTYLINMTVDIVRRPNFYNIAQIYLSRNRNGTLTRLSLSVIKDVPSDETENSLSICYMGTFLVADNIVMEGWCNQDWEAFGDSSNPSGPSKTHINFVKLM